MIKPNITPGNWIAGSLREGFHPIFTLCSDWPLADVLQEHSQGRHKANARAIAATPKLLEALERALELAETARQYFPKSVKNSDRFKLELSNATIKAALIEAGYTF